MFSWNRYRNQQLSMPNQTINLRTSFPTEVRHQPTSFPTQTQNRQTSFPELVGWSAKEAVAYISARGLKPILIKPNQPVTMDYRLDRVRIVTDPSGRVVIEKPVVG